MTCDFQQCGNLTSVNSGEPAQPPFKLRNSKSCSVSSLTVIDTSSDLQRLWSDCAYAQAGLSLCWSHIPHFWKSLVAAQLLIWSTIWLCIIEPYNEPFAISGTAQPSIHVDWSVSPVSAILPKTKSNNQIFKSQMKLRSCLLKSHLVA